MGRRLTEKRQRSVREYLVDQNGQGAAIAAGYKPTQSLSSRISTIAWCGLVALAVTMVAGGVWTALLLANLATSPVVPWAVFVMAVFLWLTWQYLDGKGQPASTSEKRHHYLRASSVPPPVFMWALSAGMLSIVALAGLWIILFQLVKIPGNALPDFSSYPVFTVALTLVMASLVGAVTEEAGFRGYLQTALERECPGAAAIALAAVVMAPVHGLTQGFVWPTLLFYFFVDGMLGVTAYLTRSILPGVVVHTIGLLTFFALVWPHDTARHLVSDGGADAWFWIHAAQAIVFASLAVLAFQHLATLAKHRS